ncbi:NYN domain-containing protein [Streptosporangiaceae bacterium NEAU-GS5]|nr:NYN domain-containing protein [Streptosporangiaceae bacterium NEAU-GS5]
MTRVRVGVFYDGGWFSHLWHWFEDCSPWKAAPSFPGIHGVLRWYLHDQLTRPVADIEIRHAAYVLGRGTGSGRVSGVGATWSASSEWDQILAAEGIVRLDATLGRNGVRGAEVQLSMAALDLAANGALDVAALITGDADFVPLVTRLRQYGVRVMVPTISVDYVRDGVERRMRISRELEQAADDSPSWIDLLEAGLRPDYARQMRYPFVRPVAANGRISVSEDGYRYGTANRWRPGEAFGFLTASDGLRWYVHRDDLVGCDSLTEGRQVRFNGRPKPLPGARYPQARSVEPVSLLGDDASGAEAHDPDCGHEHSSDEQGQ